MPACCPFVRVVALCAGVLLAGAATASAAPRLSACPGQGGFRCATLRVPLDRSDPTPGTLSLRYAVQRVSGHGRRRVLIALMGGPGQPSVDLAGSLALSLEPALRRYRLVVLDQRGTAGQSTLSCPNIQRLRSLDALSAAAVARCAQRIGPRRAFFTTADTVLDLEDLRRALGVREVALMGISYGTYVALQYARAFPRRVDRLILDSVVGPDQPDGFLLDSYGAVARVLRETCARRACARVTEDPVADVAALVTRLAAGPLRGTLLDARGRQRRTAYHNAEELFGLLQAGDLNPFLQAALPAAVAAANAGDPALLMRLRRPAEGAPTRLRELSFGLLVTTACEDARMPYTLQTPIADRTALVDGALGAIPPTRYAPFDAQTVRRTSNAADCVQWPIDGVRPPFSGPLPNVPTLLLSGRLDMRTPLENAQTTARQLPRATIVALRGSGHDVIDADITGCSAVALERFVAGRRVGQPCAGQDNGVPPFPRPPRSLSDVPEPAAGGGRRGRAVVAALDTVSDAHATALIQLYAGLSPRGGGLRGGRFTATTTGDGQLVLDRYAYVPGLRLSGVVHTDGGGGVRGSVRVRGLGLDGTLSFDGRGGVRGVLGGRRVSYGARGSGARLASTGELKRSGAALVASGGLGRAVGGQ